VRPATWSRGLQELFVVLALDFVVLAVVLQLRGCFLELLLAFS
jgi:hypothetical protein